MTEIHSIHNSLCLEKDKRSIYTASVLLKNFNYFQFNAVFDMISGRLPDLFARINGLNNSGITALFQHPNPSNPKTMSKVGKDCIPSLLNGTISQIVFVYDTKEEGQRGTWWRWSNLCETFLKS